MRKLILTALVAATVMPIAAEAQDRGDLRRDRREIRDDPRDLREDRRDARDDRNRRWSDNDWRDWRNRNRGDFSRGNWRAPFRYYASARACVSRPVITGRATGSPIRGAIACRQPVTASAGCVTMTICCSSIRAAAS